MPSKNDASTSKSLIPRPKLTKVEKKMRSSDKITKVLKTRLGDDKENRVVRNSVNKCEKKKSLNPQLKILRNEENVPLKTDLVKNKNTELPSLSTTKTFIQKQTDAGLIQFEADSKSLLSILNNKGITNELANGIISNFRPSLYRSSNRFSTKKTTLEEVTRRFASVCDRIVNAPAEPSTGAVVRKTPVRLSLYGRCSSTVKPLINTPRTLFTGGTQSTLLKVPANEFSAKDDQFIDNTLPTTSDNTAALLLTVSKYSSLEINQKSLENTTSSQLSQQRNNLLLTSQMEKRNQTCVSQKFDNKTEIESKADHITISPTTELERQINSMNNDELCNELAYLEKKKSIIEQRLKTRQKLFSTEITGNECIPLPVVSIANCPTDQVDECTVKKPVLTGLAPIKESVENDDVVVVVRSCSPKLKKRDSAFAAYNKTDDECSLRIATEKMPLLQTPKPKRRLAGSSVVDNNKSPLNESLIVSPLCDADLITVDPPIKTPLLLRSVAMRAKYERSANRQRLLNSSPVSSYDKCDQYDQSSPVRSQDVVACLGHVSPIEKTGYNRIGGLGFWLANLITFDETLDRLCDAEVESASNFYAKRLKISSSCDLLSTSTTVIAAARVQEPVALTLTIGDDTNFIPIVEE